LEIGGKAKMATIANTARPAMVRNGARRVLGTPRALPALRIPGLL
jgi:hypothetical protein